MKKIKGALPICGVAVLLAIPIWGQTHHENSLQLIQQINQELGSASEQLHRCDTDKAGHKYQAEKLMRELQHEMEDLQANLYPNQK
jgi:predicted translin family RNA/ssDNA-binding protein